MNFTKLYIFIFAGVILNMVIIFPVWFILNYMNPRTYYGNGGFNADLAMLIIILVFGMITWLIVKNKSLEVRMASLVNISFSVILFSIITAASMFK